MTTETLCKPGEARNVWFGLILRNPKANNRTHWHRGAKITMTEEQERKLKFSDGNGDITKKLELKLKEMLGVEEVSIVGITIGNCYICQEIGKIFESKGINTPRPVELNIKDDPNFA